MKLMKGEAQGVGTSKKTNDIPDSENLLIHQLARRK